MTSMLITPAATALLLGVAAAFRRLYLSFFNLLSGPVMALLSTVFFILALAWKQLFIRPTGLGGPAEPTG